MDMRPAAPEADAGSDDSIAIAALNFLASDGKRLERFLSVTGLGPHNLRRAASEANFLRSVLEYVAGDEPLLLAFAAEARLEPGQVARALEDGPAHGGARRTSGHD